MSDEVTIEDPAALLKAHEKLKADIVQLRADLKGLEKERDDLKTLSESLSPENVEKMRQRALKSEIKAQLESDGVPNAEGVLKYLDLDGVDFDEDDKIVGIDEKLETLRNDLPLLFDKKARAGRTSADIHADTPANTNKSTTEAQVDALFGSR